MAKELDDLKHNNMKTSLPKKSKVKSNKTKAIRVDEENYEYLRRKAFEEKTSIKDLADKIIEKEMESNL